MKPLLSVRVLALMSLGLCMATAHVASQATEFSFSGFGTLGYAKSNRAYLYQRFLDEDGTVKRDTVLGAQVDAKLSSEWSATLQAKVAPSLHNDEDWSLTASWAFLSWRPNNDWLLRLGKQRVPMYLNSENMDVGQTYDFARLPFEMYGLSPSNDFKGLYVSRNWLPDIGEVTLDTFHGETDLTARAHTRDLGPIFTPVCTTVTGGVLTLKRDTSTWRMGMHHTVTRRRDGLPFPSHFPYVSAGGYYRVNDLMPGPEPVETTSSIVNNVITLGADVELAPDWRLVSEFARNIQERTENGSNTAGGYVAVLHKIGAFTPYVSYAKLRSMGVSVRMADALNAAQSPAFDAYGPMLNASQRIASDAIMVYDQDTVALGTSYALTAQSKVKAEWARTRVGNRTATVESPAGEDVVRRQHINVLSLNYSFVF